MDKVWFRRRAHYRPKVQYQRQISPEFEDLNFHIHIPGNVVPSIYKYIQVYNAFLKPTTLENGGYI